MSLLAARLRGPVLAVALATIAFAGNAGCFTRPDASKMVCNDSQYCPNGYVCVLEADVGRCRPESSVGPGATDAPLDGTMELDGSSVDYGRSPIDRGLDGAAVDGRPPLDASLDGTIPSVDSSSMVDAPATLSPVEAGSRVLGDYCLADSECTTGFCIDGVCCESACGGRCQACAEKDRLGRCTTVSSGQPRGSRPSCGGAGVCAGQCDGMSASKCTYPATETECAPASCTSAAQAQAASVCGGDGTCTAGITSMCQSDRVCKSGRCVDPTLKDLGAACQLGTECGSGFCVDGVCCNAACGGQCQACDATGVCNKVTSGTPVGGRAPCAGTGICAGVCDGASASQCSYPGSTTQCAPATCSSPSAAQAASYCSGAGACVAPGPRECTSGTCSGNACAVQVGIGAPCTSTGQCASGLTCTNGLCSAANGSSCNAAKDCASGFCVDGVCCESACAGQCQVCSAAGICTLVTSGAPKGSRPTCTGTGTLCGGSCDGNSPSQCSYPGGATQCAPATCSSASAAQAASVCNGSGTCTPGSVATCSSGICTNNACLAQVGLGAPCTSTGQCTSGLTCTNGYCAGPTGTSCTAARDCVGGFCVDGVCCNSACQGQCQACSAAGTCVTVTSGVPMGSRPPCAGVGGPCGGTCDGTWATQCSYPGGTVQCLPVSCSAGQLHTASYCSGAGICITGSVNACDSGLCLNNACAPKGGVGASCTVDANCETGLKCIGSLCTATNGTACTAASQCQSGFCADNVCCDKACTGQCEACAESSKVGTCSNIPANQAPRGTRAACSGSGICAGKCTGTSPSCGYPGTECSPYQCINGNGHQSWCSNGTCTGYTLGPC